MDSRGFLTTNAIDSEAKITESSILALFDDFDTYKIKITEKFLANEIDITLDAAFKEFVELTRQLEETLKKSSPDITEALNDYQNGWDTIQENNKHLLDTSLMVDCQQHFIKINNALNVKESKEESHTDSLATKPTSNLSPQKIEKSDPVAETKSPSPRRDNSTGRRTVGMMAGVITSILLLEFKLSPILLLAGPFAPAAFAGVFLVSVIAGGIIGHYYPTLFEKIKKCFSSSNEDSSRSDKNLTTSSIEVSQNDSISNVEVLRRLSTESTRNTSIIESKYNKPENVKNASVAISTGKTPDVPQKKELSDYAIFTKAREYGLTADAIKSTDDILANKYNMRSQW